MLVILRSLNWDARKLFVFRFPCNHWPFRIHSAWRIVCRSQGNYSSATVSTLPFKRRHEMGGENDTIISNPKNIWVVRWFLALLRTTYHHPSMYSSSQWNHSKSIPGWNFEQRFQNILVLCIFWMKHQDLDNVIVYFLKLATSSPSNDACQVVEGPWVTIHYINKKVTNLSLPHYQFDWETTRKCRPFFLFKYKLGKGKLWPSGGKIKVENPISSHDIHFRNELVAQKFIIRECKSRIVDSGSRRCGP